MRLAIALTFIVLVQIVNGQEKRPKTASNQGHAEGVPQPQSPTAPVVVVHEEQSSKEERGTEDHAESYLCRLFSPENLPNIGLFFAGLGGIWVGVYTLRQIRTQTGLLRQYVEATQNSVIASQHSTEAMLKSVTLQEIQSRQWLELQDVGVDSPIIPHGVAETELTLTFQVINPTKMALTLKDIEITLFEDDRFYYRRLEYTLIPDGNYPVSIKIHLVEHAFRAYVKTYEKGFYVIPVIGLIKFEDAFEKTRQQSLGFDCRRSQGKWEFTIPKKLFPRCTKGDDAQQEDKQAN